MADTDAIPKWEDFEPDTTCPEIVDQVEVADGTIDVLCGAGAVVLNHFTWPSTNGPVTHETTKCLGRDGRPSHVITRVVGGLSASEAVFQEARAAATIGVQLSPLAES